MDKNEILKMAKEENKGRDFAEIEAQKRDETIALIVAYIMATVLSAVQIVAGKGLNFGLYLVVTTISSVLYVSKARRNPIWQHIVSAAAYVLSAVLFGIAFVIYLFR